MGIEFRFCPHCGTDLVERDVFDDIRRVCPSCGFIHFHDPKVAVIGLITWGDRVLLIRRGVEPGRGKWALPGGYVDAGEMPEEALTREIREEVGLTIEHVRFLGFYRMEATNRIVGGIVIAFHATPSGAMLPTPQGDDDVDEAAWYGATELPDEIAFESSVELLTKWRDDNLASPQRSQKLNTWNRK